MKEDANGEVNINIHFNKKDGKTWLTLIIGLTAIFFLTSSKELRIGIVILFVVAVLSALSRALSHTDTEEKSKEAEPKPEKKKESTGSKEIRKPEMPAPSAEHKEKPEPAPKVKTEDKDLSDDDWADFFASLDNDK